MGNHNHKEDQNHHSHDHKHYHGHHHHHHDGNLKTAFFLNLFFTIIELIGGFFTNSVAILSDAIHDLGDTIAIGSSLVLEKYSYKGRDSKYSYGYRRFSPLAGLINTVILISGSIIMISESFPRLLNPEEVKSNEMIIFAILGVVFNGLAVLKLKGEKNKANQRVILLHLMEDVLGWAAVLVGAIIIKFTGILILDPILSLSIALYILYNAFKNMFSISKIFLQATPNDVSIDDMTNRLKKVKNVNSVHDLHLWTLDGEYNIITVHLVIPDETTNEQILEIKENSRNIFKEFNQEHYTIEIEFESEKCAFQDC